MDAIEKLRAKGMHDIANEFMRNRNELIVARRSLLVSHQINEEYRKKIELLQTSSTDAERDDATEGGALGKGAVPGHQDEHALIERCASLTQALEAARSEGVALKDKFEQSKRSLALAMRTAQEEAAARAQAENEKTRLQEENNARDARESVLRRHAENLEAQVARLEAQVARLEAQAPSVHAQDQARGQAPVQELIDTLETRLEMQRDELEALSGVRSENEALKRQIEDLSAAHMRLSALGEVAESAQGEAERMIRQLQDAKQTLEQNADMASRAMQTLRSDMDGLRHELSEAGREKDRLMSRNAELVEKLRQLEARTEGSLAPARCNEDAPATHNEDVLARQQAGVLLMRSILEETLMKERLPDALQRQALEDSIAACEAQMTPGARDALARMIEIEKGRLTRRILAVLSAED